MKLSKSNAELPEATIKEARQAILSAAGGSSSYKDFGKLAAAVRHNYTPKGKHLTDSTLRNAANELFNEGKVTSKTTDIKRR